MLCHLDVGDLFAPDGHGDDDAPLEDVASIAWSEDGEFFRFTVSEDFRTDTGIADDVLEGGDAVTGYKSATSDNMIGPIEYIE